MRDDFHEFEVHVVIDDDGDYVAHFVELPNVSVYGETAEEAIDELKIAWEAMKQSYHKHADEIPIASTKKE